MTLAFIVYNFSLFFLCALTYVFCNSRDTRFSKTIVGIGFVFYYTLVFGLRQNVGGDYEGYANYYIDVVNGATSNDVPYEYGFYCLMKFLSFISKSPLTLFVFTSFAQSSLLLFIINRFKRFGCLILFFYFVSLYLFESLNIIRQSLAFLLLVVSLIFIYDKKRISSLAAFFAAVLIHKSAFIVAPFLLLKNLNLYRHKNFLIFIFFLAYFTANRSAAYLMELMTNLTVDTNIESYGVVQKDLFLTGNSDSIGFAEGFLFIIDLIILAYMPSLCREYKKYPIVLISNLFVVGCLIQPSLNKLNYITISRIAYYFTSARFIMVSALLFFFLSKIGRNNIYKYFSYFVIALFFAWFNNSIYIGAAWCAPFEFIFQ